MTTTTAAGASVAAGSAPASARAWASVPDSAAPASAANAVAEATSDSRSSACWPRALQNGYAVIKTIAERTGGAWKPSPGSVYPTLQQLVDEDLVVSSGDGRKTLFELTDAGKAETEAKADEIAAALDGAPGIPDAQREFFEALRKTMGVLHMYRSTATEEQAKAATAKVDQLRKDLLQILAD
ncbi:PadR family transcriptional regulator [Curtobacterium flaccumfaciens]|nr:PadR family transcriptional regulator [Curtobacterium flaccumfaciens]